MRLQQLIHHSGSFVIWALLIGTPLLSHAQGQLSLVYQAASSTNLHAAWLSDGLWNSDDKIRVAGQTLYSNSAPSSVIFKNKLYVVYNQGGYIKDLYHAWFDGTHWRGNKRIWADGKVLKSNTTPSLAILKDKLYMIFQNGITPFYYYAQFDGEEWTKVMPITLEENYLVAATTPTAVVFKEKLYLIYPNQETNALHMVHLDGLQWKNDKIIQIPMGNTLKSPFSPGAAVFKDKLYIVYKQMSSNHLYTAQYDGKKWQHNNLIPPVDGEFLQSGYNPRLTVFHKKLYLFYRNAHNNDMYSAWFDGKNWGGNTAINKQPYWFNVESNFNPSVAVFSNPTTTVGHPTTTQAQYLEIPLSAQADYF